MNPPTAVQPHTPDQVRRRLGLGVAGVVLAVAWPWPWP